MLGERLPLTALDREVACPSSRRRTGGCRPHACGSEMPRWRVLCRLKAALLFRVDIGAKPLVSGPGALHAPPGHLSYPDRRPASGACHHSKGATFIRPAPRLLGDLPGRREAPADAVGADPPAFDEVVDPLLGGQPPRKAAAPSTSRNPSSRRLLDEVGDALGDRVQGCLFDRQQQWSWLSCAGRCLWSVRIARAGVIGAMRSQPSRFSYWSRPLGRLQPDWTPASRALRGWSGLRPLERV